MRALLLLLLLSTVSTASAQAKLPPTLTAQWAGEQVVLKPRADQGLLTAESAAWRLSLRWDGGWGWDLAVEERIDDGAPHRPSYCWQLVDAIRLEPRLEARGREEGLSLRGGAFLAWVPLAAEAQAPSGALADRPQVRVLITGFDRFPLAANHPTHVRRGGLGPGAPNPSSWLVDAFEPDSLDPALRRRARILVHKLSHVPVIYGEAAQRVTRGIRVLEPHVVIAFGQGGGGDGEVEHTAYNRLDDCNDDERKSGPGPFRLPTTWPPAGSQPWSDADERWLERTPDNAGVSYNGASIDSQGPARLTSTLPSREIARRLQRAGLRVSRSTDPGRYICNETMYRVIQTQNARGGLGGFVHVPAWSEARRAKYLRVVQEAIEASVEAELERRTEASN